MRRRALLTAVSTAGLTLAGCLDRNPSGSNERESSADRSPGETPSRPSPNGTSSPTHTRTEPGTAVRCRGDSVSAERSVTDRSGYEDDIRYFPGNETVRYVAARNSDGPAFFETMSFEQWGSIECAGVGLERVRSVTADRLGTDAFGSGRGTPPDGFSADSMVILLHVSTQVEDGDPVRTPTVSLGRLADVAPRSVDATVSLDGTEYSRTVPVYASHQTVGFVDTGSAPEFEARAGGRR